MMSVMALDGVTLFWRLKDVTNTCQPMQKSPIIPEFLQCNGGKVEEAEDFKCVLIVYCVCLNRNRTALVGELLSKNSLLVGKLY